MEHNKFSRRRVSIWTMFVQHTDSTNFRSLFLIFWYHMALHCSQPVVAFLPQADYELSTPTLVTGLALAFVCFALELAADVQMMNFKKAKKEGYTGLIAGKRVLDTGLWAVCPPIKKNKKNARV